MNSIAPVSPELRTAPQESRYARGWHCLPEGQAPSPELAIPRIDAAFSAEWSDWSMVKWTIHNHCRELLDNIADMAHFEPVHGFNRVLYFADLFEGHKATQVMVGANDRLGGQDDHLTSIATYFGPAYQITHMFGAMGGVPVEAVLVNSHTPIDPHSFELRFGVMVRKFPGMSEEQCAAAVNTYVERTNQAFAEDVEIWHNKVRIDKPLLCDGDGPVYQNRRWYEQFYMDAAAVPAELRQRRVIEIGRRRSRSARRSTRFSARSMKARWTRAPGAAPCTCCRRSCRPRTSA